MIKIVNVRHEVAERELFRGLDWILNDHEKVGLVGHNGIGKSTLARILAGEIDPTEGKVLLDGEVLYFPQFENFEGNTLLSDYLLSIWENLNLQSELIQKLIFNLDLSKRLSFLSGGEWMRARLALALSKSPKFLIMDEPTNNLDRNGRDSIVEFIRECTQGLLIISHDREILNCLQEITELSSLGLKHYGGNFDFYWKTQNLEQQRMEDEVIDKKRLAKIKELERYTKLRAQEKRMRRGKITGDKMGLPRILKTARKIHAQETLNKIKIRNDVIVDRSHVEVEFALKNRKKNPFLRFDFESHVMPASKIAIRVGALNIGYGERRLWEKDLNWTVQGFQRWHLRGLNGSGKTSLLKVLANKLEVATVTKENIFMVQNYCYLDQNLSLLDHDRSVMENIVEESRFDEKQIRNELAFFGFTNDQALQKVKTLSGGELLRAGLAKMFLGKQIPELVLLDEPTNNLDLASIVYLEKALKEYRGALVVVSHDLKFVESLEITHELWVETGLMKQID